MLVVSPENISAVMAPSPPRLSIAELDAAVREGLPKSALREIVDHIVRTSEERRALMSRIVPEATFERRKDRLTPDESEKTERLARIFATVNSEKRFALLQEILRYCASQSLLACCFTQEYRLQEIADMLDGRYPRYARTRAKLSARRDPYGRPQF